MQADPSEWTALRVAYLKGEIRNLYWYIRTLSRARAGAARRRYYRQIAKLKAELIELGCTRRELLDLLACCRRKVCREGCSSCGKTVNWQRWI